VIYSIVLKEGSFTRHMYTRMSLQKKLKDETEFDISTDRYPPVYKSEFGDTG